MPMYDENYVKPPSEKDLLDKQLRDHYQTRTSGLFDALESAEDSFIELTKEYYKAKGQMTFDEDRQLQANLSTARFSLIQTRVVIEQINRAAQNRAHGPNRFITPEEQENIDEYKRLKELLLVAKEEKDKQ